MYHEGEDKELNVNDLTLDHIEDVPMTWAFKSQAMASSSSLSICALIPFGFWVFERYVPIPG